MKYYAYVESIDTKVFDMVFTTVSKYKPLAISKYGSNWKDALDATLFHVLSHYDLAKGSLESYVCSIVSTIHLNRFSKEFNMGIDPDSEETLFDVKADEYAIQKSEETNPLSELLAKEEDEEYAQNLSSCVHYLLPYFLKDYELFKTRDASNRKLNYSGLFTKYSAQVIADAVDVLASDYEAAKYLKVVSKGCHARNFGTDRYKKSIDKSLEYITRIGDIVKCKAHGVVRQKYIYLLDIQDILNSLSIMFYSEEGIAVRKIYDTDVYCSVSGQLILDKKELYKTLEREIIGSLLASRTNLKVLHYDVGKELLLTSTNFEEAPIVLQLFQTGIYIPMVRLVMGAVEK